MVQEECFDLFVKFLVIVWKDYHEYLNVRMLFEEFVGFMDEILLLKIL